MKRIATIQDISCIGKCSLTVALPVISAMGIETAVIPTAVLSNHTAFSAFTFKDLTPEIPGIMDRWKEEKIRLDAVYSGYLGSLSQIDLVAGMFRNFAPALKFVDPAMADNGSLYKGFDDAYVEGMKALCGKADVIVPNLTEACLLTGLPYKEDQEEAYMKDLLRKLTDLGCSRAVLTGVSFQEKELGAMCYDRERDRYDLYCNEKIATMFHGTGDIFASCLVGSMVDGMPLEEGMALAVDYTLECIRETMKDKDHEWYGVNFEKALPWLVKRLDRGNI